MKPQVSIINYQEGGVDRWIKVIKLNMDEARENLIVLHESSTTSLILDHWYMCFHQLNFLILFSIICIQ